MNNLPIANQTSNVFNFEAAELGSFEVKVLVTDNKDYTTHKWDLTVANETSDSFTITGTAGAAVGVAEQDGFSLWSWLASLLS